MWKDEPAEAPTVYRVQPNSKCWALLLGPVAWRTLHFVSSQGSVPCDGPGCRHCPKKKFERGYVEAIVYWREPNTGEERSRRVILELHRQAWSVIAGRPPRGLMLELTRGAGKYEAPVAKDAKAPAHVPQALWDVKAHMERVWDTRFGLYEPDQEWKEAQ
jgi:hypothetical protein